MLDGLDNSSRARASLKFRKRNINNNSEEVDSLAQLNFLNRLDQLDRELQILRDLIMIEMTQSRSMRDRMKKWKRHMMELTMNDLTMSETSSCCSDQEDPLNDALAELVLSGNNNSHTRDQQKEKEKSPEEEEDEVPDLLFYDNPYL